jgi:DNA-binding NarL/FixJ family response regulator
MALRMAGGRGAGDRVQELLEQALALYEELGLEQGADATRGLLTDLPIHAGHRAAYPDGLSTREAQVLRLLAVGKSNREIAETLVLSENTVTFHVKSIFNKTGVASRTEAANYTLRHHLVNAPI